VEIFPFIFFLICLNLRPFTIAPSTPRENDPLFARRPFCRFCAIQETAPFPLTLVPSESNLLPSPRSPLVRNGLVHFPESSVFLVRHLRSCWPSFFPLNDVSFLQPWFPVVSPLSFFHLRLLGICPLHLLVLPFCGVFLLFPGSFNV